MSLTIKAFLYEQSWRDDPKEIRRFSVDQDVSTSYAYLLEKLAQVFPSVQAGSVIVAWMDGDGDLVVISSDEELVEALDQFDGTVFRLYLMRRSSGVFERGPPTREQEEPTVKRGESSQQPNTEGETEAPPTQQQQQQRPPPTQQQGGVFHPGVECDGCSGPIYGTRFKCLVCSDYDLCAGCEAQGKHVDHNMVSITDPSSYNPWGFDNPWAHRFGPRQGGRPCHDWWGPRWWQQRFGGHHPPHHGGYGPGPCHPWGYGGRHQGCPRGGFQGRRWCGGFPPSPWWKNVADAHNDAAQAGGASEPMETGADSQQQSQPQQQQQYQAPTEEERKSFLQGVGQAVSSFLEPFGVKVDVDVVRDGEKTPSAPPPSSGEAGSSAATAEPQPSEEVPSEFIEQTLTQLRSMGYEDEGGWLTELVKAKGGDITKVLDALHPTIAETD